ncbi:SCO3374 family protein [Streptomyces sp. NPDC006251]|uniref:SCO3374 family protein n=1 Tax=Streptomyces sp. NPDC006251 TaxID=3155718 RepID=UPI0033BD8D45
MFSASPPVLPSASRAVPLPRRPPGPVGPDVSGRLRRWYENELGWPTVPGDPLRLVVGVRFDVLDVPAEAGHAALGRLGRGSPVAVRGDRMLLLVAVGSAEELPGLLEWLEWGGLALDLGAIGPQGFMDAPPPTGAGERPGSGLTTERPGNGVLAEHPGSSLTTERPGSGLVAEKGAQRPPGVGAEPHPDRAARSVTGAGPSPSPGPGPCAGRPLPPGRFGSQGAAVWLRPPEPGCEVEASLPTLSALGGAGDAPDLVRLVDTVATWCHRIRLRRAGAQPPASRAQGR